MESGCTGQGHGEGKCRNESSLKTKGKNAQTKLEICIQGKRGNFLG
jgi:hypothetical protein